MSRTPKIRFINYTDDWEQRNLLDCIQNITDFRGRTPKKLGMDWSENGYLALSALNVKDGYIDFTQDVHYGDQTLYDKWMTGNELHMGQVLFTTEAPMGNVAQVPDNRRYILSQRTIAFDVKPNLITENFLATVLRSPAVFAMLTALSSGGTAKGVSQKSLATVDILIPSDLTEQEHLAATFSQLDTLTTLHQHKYNKIISLRKACLEKLFPQYTQNTPSIRISGYNDIWKKKRIGNIAIEKLTNGVMNCTSAQTTSIRHINVIDMYQPDKIHIDELSFSGYDDTVVKKCNVEYGDIFLTRSSLKPAGIAEPNVLLDEGRYVFDDHLIRLKIDQSRYDPLFVKYLLETDYVKKQFISRAKTTAFTTIGQDDIADCFGLFPLFEEQQQIGEFFNIINRLVFAYKHKLMKLKQLKQAMLHNMFV